MVLTTHTHTLVVITVTAAILGVMLTPVLARQLLHGHIGAAARTTVAVLVLAGVTCAAAIPLATVPVSAPLTT